MSSFFAHVPLEPPNVILGVARACASDPSPDKIDLVIGAYRDQAGKPVVLPVVRKAEEIVFSQNLDHEYLSQDGHALFVSSSQILMFGEESSVIAENKVYSIQSLSGTGSLRLGTDFLAAHFNTATCYYPQVTWPNHPVIFKSAGMKSATYRYLDSTGCFLDFDAMIEDLNQCPEGSVILLHACAHNPTGVDPSENQWRQILDVVKQRKLLPFFDNAYQGFVSGCPTTDAFAVRLFAENNMQMLVACSFAKNFGLYGERVGILHVVLGDSSEIPQVGSQLRALSRALYSTPPAYGARLVATILSDPIRKNEWMLQCRDMAERLNSIRLQLYNLLVSKNVLGKWEHVIAQKGMFSYSGIPAWATEKLKSEFHIYLLSNGRISLAGLNDSNVERFADALAAVLGKNE